MLLRKYFYSFCLLCFIGIAVSCQKDEVATRSMMDLKGDIKVSGGDTAVHLAWSRAIFSKNDIVTYTVEVSKDSTFMNTQDIVAQKISGETISFNHDVLTPMEIYFARVMADASGLSTKSNWVYSERFYITDTIALINLFASVKENEISDEAAILRWEKDGGVTNVKVMESGSKNGTDFPLSAANVSDSSVIVSGLAPNTGYDAELFKGDTSVGLVSFITKTALVGPNIIDLTKVAPRAGLLNETLASANSGDIIVLKRDATYDLTDAMLLDKSISFMSGRGLEGQAIINFAGAASFDMQTGSVIDSVKFDDVQIKGQYDRDYALNISRASHLGKLVFVNSYLKDLRGVVRVKDANQVNIDNFICDNSIIEHINGYGLFNMDNGNAASGVGNILLQNSTFIDINVFIASKNKSNSITLSDNTFYLSPGSGRYLIDYNTNDVTSGVLLKNNIFGKSDNSRGIRVGAASTVTVENSFATDDNSGQIGGVSKYGGSSFGLFKNPDLYDFTLVKKDLGRIGDPRWYR